MDATLSNRAAPPGSMRYFAALYAPDTAREYVYAMYSIEAEVRDSAASANHEVAHTRLRWWREEIERLSQGRPQHPASKVVLEAPLQPDWSTLQQLLFAAEVELSRMTFDTARELNAYLERGGVVQELIGQLTSSEPLSEEERAHARRFGAIARHAEVLRNLRVEARNGQIYLPLQLLEAANVQHHELSAEQPSAALRGIIATEAQRSLSEFKERRAALTKDSRIRLRPVLVFAALCARLLERLARGGYSAQPALELGGFERAWLAWRTAVRAR